MKARNRKVLAGVVAAAMVLSAGSVSAFALSYTDGSAIQGNDTAWSQWADEWKTVATDYEKVSMTPGADQTQLNFAWYSKVVDGKEATPAVHWATKADMSDAKVFQGATQAVKDIDANDPSAQQDFTNGVPYVSNHVTVTGLAANTTYYYTVEKNGEQTEPAQYRTGDFETAKMLFVGDPQIGASKGKSQNGDKLVAEGGAANTAARNDAYSWDRTLDTAVKANPDVDFIISAGDQVNKTGGAKEEEYAGYLNASALRNLPVATTIGNHDSLNSDYYLHFNNPNATQNGLTDAGGDYYYRYAGGLFIVLNTNNYNGAEHEKTIQEAVKKYPDAKWRVVTIHQDIYGSGADHSGTDGMIQRTQLTPIFDKYDIDVVLQGHDHSYTRSKMIESDAASHQSYQMPFVKEENDYDWGNAQNAQTSQLYPLPDFTSGEPADPGYYPFANDNKCYVLQDVAGSSVTNPTGTLYLSSNSASGSKFYELIGSQQNYIAARNQDEKPNYSVIEMTGDRFAVTTYAVEQDGSTSVVDDTFTIQKTGEADAQAVKCSETGDVNLAFGASNVFTVKTADEEVAKTITVGTGLYATIDTVKAWDAASQTATYRIYPYWKSDAATGVYCGGKKLFTARIAQRPFESDTTVNFSLAKGKTYNARITLNKPEDGQAMNPAYGFCTGNSSVLGDTVLKTKELPDGRIQYDFRVTAKGAGATGVYMNVAGVNYKIFTVSVGE